MCKSAKEEGAESKMIGAGKRKREKELRGGGERYNADENRAKRSQEEEEIEEAWK